MAYEYETEKSKLFTEGGVELLRKIERNVEKLLGQAGAFRLEAAFTDLGCYDSWTAIACIDHLCEQGKIKEVGKGEACMGQDRVFRRVG